MVKGKEKLGNQYKNVIACTVLRPISFLEIKQKLYL